MQMIHSHKTVVFSSKNQTCWGDKISNHPSHIFCPVPKSTGGDAACSICWLKEELPFLPENL